MISENLKSIFVHNPKTAGASMKNVLFKMSDDWKFDDWHYNIETLSRKCKGDWRDYFSFAFCRNPYSRFVSGFIHNLNRLQDPGDYHWSQYPYSYKVLCSWLDGTDLTICFKKFVNSTDFDMIFNKGWPIHIQPQYRFLTNLDNYFKIDYVGRFEDINTQHCDFYKMMDIFGVEDYYLPHLHSNHINHYEFYDGATMDRVFDKYRLDFEIFGYDRSFL
jgi:hypothetical protein